MRLKLGLAMAALMMIVGCDNNPDAPSVNPPSSGGAAAAPAPSASPDQAKKARPRNLQAPARANPAD